MNKPSRCKHNGQGMSEYFIMGALVAVVSVGAVVSIGTKVSGTFGSMIPGKAHVAAVTPPNAGQPPGDDGSGSGQGANPPGTNLPPPGGSGDGPMAALPPTLHEKNPGTPGGSTTGGMGDTGHTKDDPNKTPHKPTPLAINVPPVNSVSQPPGKTKTIGAPGDGMFHAAVLPRPPHPLRRTIR